LAVSFLLKVMLLTI